MPSHPTPHPDSQRLADYRAGRLSAPGMLGVSDHLAECPACREALAGTDPGGKTEPPTLLPDAPPSYEEMAALLDRTLNETQATEVGARLAASPGAAAEFTDLRRFHEEAIALPPRIHGPARGGAAVPVNEAGPALGKVVKFPGTRWRPWWVAAAAALVFLTAGWWLSTTRHPTGGPSLWADADLSRLPDDLRRSVEQAARSGTFEAPALPAPLRPPRGTLAGDAPKAAAFRQVAPGGVVVREDRPTFRWTACEGTTGYVLYLAEASEPDAVLRQEVGGGQTAWQPEKPLARGKLYEWQVEARRGDEIVDRAPRPPAAETRFQVLDAPHADELMRVEGRYGQNPLVLGTAYARVGLDAAAAGQFEQLARLYPQSDAAGRLWRSARERVAGK